MMSSSICRGELIKESAATTEQDRDLVDLNLVEHAGLDRLLHCVRTLHVDVARRRPRLWPAA